MLHKRTTSSSSFYSQNTLNKSKENTYDLVMSTSKVNQKSPEPSGKKVYHVSEHDLLPDPMEELEMEAQIRDMFKLYDANGDGTISKEELSKFLYSIGKPFKDEEVEEIFQSADRDHNGSISIDELIFYLKTKAFYIPQKEVDEILDCFRVFDTDGSMTITRKELENIFERFDVSHVSKEDLEYFFKMSDKNGDGSISYAEFVQMWKQK